MIGNFQPSETMAVVATIDPQTVANVAVLSDWVNMASWESVAFTVLLGDMAAETVDVGLQQANSSVGGGAKVLANATQLAANATLNDNKQIFLQCRAEDLDHANGFTHVAVRVITGAGTGGPMAAVGHGFNSRYGVGTDLTTVAEIKSA